MPSVAEAAVAPYENMSPMVLAASVLSLPESRDNAKPLDWWGPLFNHLETRLGILRSWRYSWWAYWSRLAEFFNPRRYHWVVVANRMSGGNPINDAIIDSTGLQALRTCASGMWSGLTNPARPWIKLGINAIGFEPDADAKAWLEDSEERIYTVLAESNFYTEMAQAFEDLALFGTAPVIVYEDHEDGIRVYLPCAGEYYLGAGARFDNNTLYREFVMTILQIVEMFKLENCPEQVRKQFSEGSVDLEYVVGHAIEPNYPVSDRGNGKGASVKKLNVVPDIFTYREVYWLKGNKTDRPLSKKGFQEKPFSGMRWSKVSNDPYGRSACMDALGDNKQVQQETRRKEEFITKGVRPPMGADPELKNEPLSLIPAGVTYMSTQGGKKGFWPLFEPNAQWLAGITADIDKVNLRIEKCLFVDVFMAITQMQGVQPRNELELTKRDLERLQKLGPVIELVENSLQEIIQRVIRILERRRLLQPMPKSMRGLPLKISFVNIMRLAQRSSESVSMKDFLATMGELSSAAKAAGLPDPLRKVNLDKAADEFADLNNVPQGIIYTDKEVAQHDQARAKAMQGQQQAQQLGPMVDAAKTLSETKPAPDNALGAILGGLNPRTPLGGAGAGT